MNENVFRSFLSIFTKYIFTDNSNSNVNVARSANNTYRI